ncbi:MAG TPA: NAD-dependent epimerase/dehydratase family protein [bacterium]|jgi:UDP-glucose 4-epimerase|nr:NAD-dependent epimerase/dehydratase family protein [bacterium]
MPRKKVLVTGVAGFIGSHMADGLMKKGYAVVGLDNLSTGERRLIPKGIRFIKGDVTRDADLGKAFGGGLAGVFHIAGCASTIKAFDDPEADLKTNTLGTVRVVQRCMKHRVKRLLYASSMTAYGFVDRLPVDVDKAIPKPVSYYGISKYAAERYALASGLRRDLGFDFGVTAFRMFNVYGRRQSLTNPYQGVASIFIGNILRQEPVKIFGDGEQSRDFIHISDVVAAWIKAFTTKAAKGEVFNLGTGRSISINTLVRTDIAAFGHDPAAYPIKYFSVRPGDQRHMRADIGKTLRVLKGWAPRMPFDKGMGDVIAWAREEAARPPRAKGSARS